MTKTFVVSDTYFGHANILRFVKSNGEKLRPWTEVVKMDEEMVGNWNSVVKPDDKVYHLGDVVINKRNLSILSRLNGRKTLIRGNHDTAKLKEYTKYFEQIHGSRPFPAVGMIFSHIPLHPGCVGRFGMCVHGHLHSNTINLDSEEDPRYYNVSVERIGYTPMDFNELIEIRKSRKEEIEELYARTPTV